MIISKTSLFKTVLYPITFFSLYPTEYILYYIRKLQYQFVHFFATLAKISVLVLKYMSRLGLAYSF